MLDTTAKTFHTTPRCVSGQFLAKNKLSERDRAKLRRNIRGGHVVVTNLTTKQIARLCRVSVYRINAADKPPTAALCKAWDKATSVERAEFVRCAGPESVWSVLASVIA